MRSAQLNANNTRGAGDLAEKHLPKEKGAVMVHIDSCSSHTIDDNRESLFQKILAAGVRVPVAQIKRNCTLFKVGPCFV